MFKSLHKRIRSLRSNKMPDDDVTMAGTGTESAATASTSGKTMAIREKEYNPSADLQELRFFYSEFYLKCQSQKCDTSLRVEDTNSHIETWLAETECIPPLRQASAITCWKCSVRTCVGCGSEPKLSQKNIFTPVGVINDCCSQGRLFGIWLLLARFDEEMLRAKKAITDANSTRRDKVNKIMKKSGIGYASDAPHGYDWVGGISHRYKTVDAAPKSEHSGDVPDDTVTETLRLLNGFLSTTSDDGDALVELSLLRLSMLIDEVAVLLRNDSIENWKERKLLYKALLAFVRRILQHPKMADLALERRPAKTNSPGLRPLAESSRFRLTLDTETPSASLFECIENICRQAKMYLEISKKNEKEVVDKDSIRICQEVVSLSDIMTAQMQPRPAMVDSKQPWDEYIKENRVTFTDDVLTTHHFHKAFSAVKGSNVGRLSTIGKEIANMTTSLPPGIFLKIAESRSDVMKVLIIGPEGGPYAGGLFIFDMFLDAKYPISPPQLYFVLPTADDDGSNFNPNLHVGGNVCLSILNTWHGAPNEMWQPHKSTILSVLISVQAMILGAPFPWANEPGREHAGDTDVSRSYNMTIQCKTVRGAMLFWLNETALQKSSAAIWKDVSEVYWRYNGEVVLRSVIQWSKDGNSRLTAYTTHPQIAPKPKSKSKKSPTKPDPETVNLLEQLAKHLGLSIEEEDYAPVDSRKRKTPTGSETSSKKTKKLPDLPMPFGFDEEAFFLSSATPASEYYHELGIEDEDEDGFDSFEEEYMVKQYGFSHGEHIDLIGNDDSKEPKWVYTGAKTRKETREACKDFNITPCKSIEDTIAKMENANNGKGAASPDLLKKWGKMRGGSGSG